MITPSAVVLMVASILRDRDLKKLASGEVHHCLAVRSARAATSEVAYTWLAGTQPWLETMVEVCL
jgi:hypothetical protein